MRLAGVGASWRPVRISALLEQESIGLDAKRDEHEAYKREPVLLKQDALLCFSVCDRGYEERRG